MPSLPFTQAMTANGSYTPLQGWQFEYLPWPANVRVLARTTGAAGTVRQAITSGSTVIQPEAPVQVGGTAGVTPSPLNTPVIEFQAPAGDRLSLAFRETAGATPTVDGIIYVDPL